MCESGRSVAEGCDRPALEATWRAGTDRRPLQEPEIDARVAQQPPSRCWCAPEGARGSALMTLCPGCRILAGELPSSPVLENDLVVAILASRPANPGHTLVMPRRHIESF